MKDSKTNAIGDLESRLDDLRKSIGGFGFVAVGDGSIRKFFELKPSIEEKARKALEPILPSWESAGLPSVKAKMKADEDELQKAHPMSARSDSEG